MIGKTQGGKVSDKIKVELHGSFDFGFAAFFGAFCAFGWVFLIFSPYDWVVNKLSSHKARYEISVDRGDKGPDVYITDDYARKLSGQLVFQDCDTGNQITLSPSTPKIEISKVDAAAARVCKH